MSARTNPNKGSQLLAQWQGDSRTQNEAAEILGLDKATYSRFLNGVRKPSGKVSFRIERITDGAVPACSWYEPIEKKRSRAA